MRLRKGRREVTRERREEEEEAMHSSDQSQGHSRLCRSDLTHSARSACRPATRSLLPARELSTEQRSRGQPKGRSRTGQLSERRRLRPTAHGAGQGTLRDRNNHQPAMTGLTMQRRRGESEVQMSLNSRLSGSTAVGSKRRIVARTLGRWSGSYSDVHAQAVSFSQHHSDDERDEHRRCAR